MLLKCKDCGCLTETYKGYQVCNKCKIVCFTEETSPEVIIETVKNYLESTQRKIIDKQDALHELEQKAILGKKLSPEEKEIRENLNSFQSIRLEIELLISHGSNFNKNHDRNLLYRLLMLSNTLNDCLAK